MAGGFQRFREHYRSVEELNAEIANLHALHADLLAACEAIRKWRSDPNRTDAQLDWIVIGELNTAIAKARAAGEKGGES